MADDPRPGDDDHRDLGHVAGEGRGLHSPFELHGREAIGRGCGQVEIQLVLDRGEHLADVPRGERGRQIRYVLQRGTSRRRSRLGSESQDAPGKQRHTRTATDPTGRIGQEYRQRGILDQDMTKAGNAGDTGSRRTEDARRAQCLEATAEEISDRPTGRGSRARGIRHVCSFPRGTQ